MARRLGSAMMLKADSMTIIYRIAYIRVKVYLWRDKGESIFTELGGREVRLVGIGGGGGAGVQAGEVYESAGMRRGGLWLGEFAGRANYRGWRPVERRKLCSRARKVLRLNTRDRDRLACRWREERQACRAVANTSGPIHFRKYKGSASRSGSAIRWVCQRRCCVENY